MPSKLSPEREKEILEELINFNKEVEEASSNPMDNLLSTYYEMSQRNYDGIDEKIKYMIDEKEKFLK